MIAEKLGRGIELLRYGHQLPLTRLQGEIIDNHLVQLDILEFTGRNALIRLLK
jgi:hypothetical protein